MEEIRNTGGAYAEHRSSKMLLVLGWISAVVSLIKFPMIFGVLGVIMGIISTKNGSKAGLSLIIASIAFMAVGLIFSGVFYNYLRHFIGL